MKFTTTECSMTHYTRLYVEVDGVEFKTALLDDEAANELAASLRDCANAIVRGRATSPAAESKTLPLEFGKGNFVVDTGTCGEAPAVFIAPAKFPGIPGQSSKREANRTDCLVDGEMVLTFLTTEQARRVANALVESTNGGTGK